MAKRPFTSRNKREKTLTVSYRYFPLWIFILIVILVLFVFLTGSRSIFRLYDLHKQHNELLQQKETLESENEQLLEQIEKLQEDLDYIEKVAREKYNLKREGEDIYKIVPEKKNDAESDQ